jgi:hypothetical protein
MPILDIDIVTPDSLQSLTGNVHVFYQPDGAGRVAFGGKLVL